ncbi:TRAP transporter small permease [Salinisphaera aquimarina]|uniref:TRAP transporter small permease protein n=1 Tax=Salinisphaera aquimarina TaxID=2094031 RepID=A0ABV7EQ05_9GAMM
MSKDRNIVLKLFESYARFEKKYVLSVATIMLLAATAIMLMEGIGRTFFDTSFFWAEESVRYLVLWAFFLTLGCAGHAGQHIRTDLVVEHLWTPLRRVASAVACLLGMVFCGMLIYAAIPQIERYHSLGMLTDSSLNLPLWVLFLVLPVGAFLWGLFYLHGLMRVLSGHEAFVNSHDDTALDMTDDVTSSDRS